MVIEAKYENGVFKPVGKINLEEGTVVEIHINRGLTSRRALSIRELGFAGMWDDRSDITDGVSYVNSLGTAEQNLIA
ncbi:MAG TPA: antitoxin family protein [Pyrinomonadaceae bacterium]|jgi:predicted DNA-binding antitoxin AbrB/MazE fold protein|nr:antitoxin family protein [Pyrinomonadaceae bacterium]